MKKLFALAAQLLLGFVISVPGTAVHADESFPTRTMRLVVPFSPGGATDIVARILAAQVEPDLKQTMIVENRAGGAGNAGTMSVVHSPPDGYTLVLATTTQLINQILSKNIEYNLYTDLVPVAFVANAPLALAVTSKLKADNIESFIRAARESSAGLNCASAGIGSVPHLGCELLGKSIQARIVHVPYRGSAGGLQALAAGDIQLSFATQASLASFMGSDLVKILAAAAPKRISALPNAPTLAEMGVKNVEISNWFGILAPKGTSPAIVARLNKAFNKALSDPVVKNKMIGLGIEPVTETPDYFVKQLERDRASYTTIINEIGLKPH